MKLVANLVKYKQSANGILDSRAEIVINTFNLPGKNTATFPLKRIQKSVFPKDKKKISFQIKQIYLPSKLKFFIFVSVGFFFFIFVLFLFWGDIALEIANASITQLPSNAPQYFLSLFLQIIDIVWGMPMKKL